MERFGVCGLFVCLPFFERGVLPGYQGTLMVVPNTGTNAYSLRPIKECNFSFSRQISVGMKRLSIPSFVCQM
jgi:hypothetical protein